jgi:hypothetical protein
VTEPADWDESWRRLEGVFASVAQELRSCNPALWLKSGRRTSPQSPFDAWAEFVRVKDPDRTEDIVVFVAVTSDEDGCRASVDIATGEGVVLADGPTRVLAPEASAVAASAMLSYVADVQRFLSDHHGVLREALC